MKYILIFIASLVAIFSLFTFYSKHDALIETAARKYAECVAREYHTTPAAWYAETGEMPECAQ